MGKVVYLTGVPASGKSSLCDLLEKNAKSTRVFRFGYELTLLVNAKTEITQEALRTSTAHVVGPADVEAVERLAIKFVQEHRRSNNIIIDTHALTREVYGFRLTPIPQNRLAELDPDFFVTMIASADAILERIARSAKGRPSLDLEQMRVQAALQNSLCAMYSVLTGKPAYFFENNTKGDLISIAKHLEALLV